MRLELLINYCYSTWGCSSVVEQVCGSEALGSAQVPQIMVIII